MNRSFEAGEAVQLPDAHSIASGLSPPYAGKQPFCIKYVSLVRSMVKAKMINTGERNLISRSHLFFKVTQIEM